MTERLPNRARARIAALVLASSLPLIGGCTVFDQARDSIDDMNGPYQSESLSDEQKIQLIDGMRDKGSYEAARERLNDTARVIGERVAAAIPGQTWKFTDDPNVQRVKAGGLACDELTGDIARRPLTDTVDFGRPFTAQEFSIAADIVRQEAAQYGATDDSSLFDEPSKRDFNLQGNGYEFDLGQIDNATLNIKGDCFLRQRVLDMPPGQLPPKPPILPTTPTPTS
nr:LppA family lipoprotein [Mycolicibacterium malmesburyense]CRL71528.1 lipoprotein LppA [Mycolicibacterium malmesburyense]